MIDNELRVTPATTSTHRPVAGLLLTGGLSRRLGVNKARLKIDGVPLADKISGLLSEVAGPVLHVGPPHPRFPTVFETPRGTGPLAAIAAGRSALIELGFDGPAVVLACDLPLLHLPLLRFLASQPGDRSVLPVIEGREQPLCARWSSADLERTVDLVRLGRRAVHEALNRLVADVVDESGLSGIATARNFADIDSASDLLDLGLDKRSEPSIAG